MLQVKSPSQTLELRVLHAGSLPIRGIRRNEVRGATVLGPRDVSVSRRRGVARVPLRVQDWPSGVYFAELRSPTGADGIRAVRARAVGEQHRVAVVMPTNTWQAYNRRDADGDGFGDTWYETGASARSTSRGRSSTAACRRTSARYDLPFLRWLFARGTEVDVLVAARARARFVGGERLRAATT